MPANTNSMIIYMNTTMNDTCVVIWKFVEFSLHARITTAVITITIASNLYLILSELFCWKGSWILMTWSAVIPGDASISRERYMRCVGDSFSSWNSFRSARFPGISVSQFRSKQFSAHDVGKMSQPQISHYQWNPPIYAAHNCVYVWCCRSLFHDSSPDTRILINSVC